MATEPILAPYETTRPGFERVRTDLCEEGLAGEDFRDVGDGTFEVCVWDIWHWAQGEKRGEPRPDPAEEDPDKQSIDAMQVALGPLSEEDRLLRIQSACLTRCYYTYPGNIDVVLRGIAAGRPDVGHISCEPPWANSLLPLLRRRYGYSGGNGDRSHERRALVRAHTTVLDAYLMGGSLTDLQEALPEHAELAATTYLHLGEPSPAKLLQVTRLRNALTVWTFTGGHHQLGFQHSRRVDEILGDALAADGQADDEITRLIGKLHNGLCHQFFFRRLEHLIAHIGAGHRCELPGVGEGRAFVVGTLVNYVHSLGSWLSGRTVDEAADIWPTSSQTLPEIYATLGEPSPRKRWLAACLWKNLQEIQSHAGLGALADEPERFRLPPSALVTG